MNCILRREILSSRSQSTPDSVATDDGLQLRICEDSGTGSAVMIKRESDDDDTNEDASSAERTDDDERHRLRFKDSAREDDSVFDGGGPRDRSPPTITAQAIVHIKTETGEGAADSNVRPWFTGGHPVRPEIIFSHRRTTDSSNHSPPPATTAPSTPVRGPPSGGSSPDQSRPSPRVPTVILGQSGGVKTMVWTGHWADSQPAPSRPRSLPAERSPKSGQRSDGNDVRLSVDGLLSLARPTQVSPSSTVSPAERPSVVSINTQRTSPTHLTTPLRVQTPVTSSSTCSPPGMGLLAVARNLHQAAYEGYAPRSPQNGHHHGLPPSIPRPANARPVIHQNGALSMERLWESAERKPQRPDSQALDYSLIGGARSVIVSSNQANGEGNGRVAVPPQSEVNGRTVQADDEEDETPMICMICEDKATGLHYGIITCEG